MRCFCHREGSFFLLGLQLKLLTVSQTRRAEVCVLRCEEARLELLLRDKDWDL